MKTLYYLAIAINILAFFMGNYFRWQKSLKVQEPIYNTATLIATILVTLTLIAVVFLADSLIIGLVTAVLLFIIVNPVITGVLGNIFMKDRVNR